MEGKRRAGKGERAEGSPGEGSKTIGDYCGSHVSVPEASKLTHVLTTRISSSRYFFDN